jgi:hypothetical protein
MSEADRPNQPSTEVAERKQITFAEFLESTPPSQTIKVTQAIKENIFSGTGQVLSVELQTPQLQLHCASDDCNGLRVFRFSGGDVKVSSRKPNHTFLTFVCSNCRERYKTYSLHVVVNDNVCECFKFGESPPYGPPTPARLIRLFGDEREMFLKGRRCENHGLGVGAFVYYRRVVENQKNRILDEIIRVCEKSGARAEMINVLMDAKNEIQFSKALASVKDAIPESLLVKGQNPLTLLHSALSGGLHGKTDEQCLELAHDVRVVLVELAERLGQALKDEAELSIAVTRLMQTKQDK